MVWNLTTLNALATLDGHSISVQALAFAQDSKLLTFESGEVNVALQGEEILCECAQQ